MKQTVAKLLQKNQPQTTLPFFQTSKISSKAFGMVRAFAANTNVGIVRKANEDRISIILNVIQPAAKQPRVPPESWPKLQIFGVYDGHGGSRCAEYLKDNLHNNSVCMSIHTTILLNKLGGVESIYQQEKLNFSAHFLMIGNFKNGRQALAI